MARRSSVNKLALAVSSVLLIAIMLLTACSFSPALPAEPEPTPAPASMPKPVPSITPLSSIKPTPVATPLPNQTSEPTPELISAPVPQPSSISISPAEATNPIKSQHMLTATVKDAGGSPVEGAEVQWILNRFPEAVGDIVEASNQSKLDNLYAISRTDAEGKATVTITATREGDTDVTALAPGITDAAKHKVFAVKHWVDMMVEWPSDAVNKMGVDHTFAIKVYKATTKKPLSDVNVKWTITDDDPNLQFAAHGAAINSATTTTDGDGISTMTVQQAVPADGENLVRIDVLSKDGVVLFSKDVTKKWLAPRLNITKAGPNTVELDLNVEYTINVRNDGEETASLVKVVDQVPEGLTFVSSSPIGTVIGSTVTWSVGNLAPDTSKDIVAKFKAVKAGKWTNTVKATSMEGLVAEATATLDVTAQAVLTVTKVGPDTVTEGQSARYTITVKNTGKIAASNTVVTDMIPACLKYVSSSPSATVSGGIATWNIGTLGVGVSRTITVTFTAAIAGTCTNPVEAVATDTPKAEASYTTVITAPRKPSVTITKSGPSAIYLNRVREFTITVTNNGETPLTNVEVTDTLPANLAYSSSTPTSIVSGRTVTWAFASLAVGASERISLLCRASALGAFENSVTVTTDEGVSDTAIATGIIRSASGMTMQVTDTVDPVAVGEETTYEVTIRNQSLITAHNVQLQVALPTNLSFVSATGPTTYSISDQTVTFDSIAELEAGISLKFTVTVKAESAGDVICGATLTYAEFSLPVTAEEGTTIFAP